MYKYTITINDGFIDYVYDFESKSGAYSIEYLAGIIQGSTDLRIKIKKNKAKKS